MPITPLKGSNPPNVNSVLQSNPGDRVSADKSSVAPIVAVMSRQLPLPQAQQLAGQVALVRVLKSGPGNEAELDVDGLAVQVKLPPGKTLTAGDMITVSFALNEKGDAASSGQARETRKTLNVQQLLLGEGEDSAPDKQSPSFVDKLSSSARLIGLLERLGQPKGAAAFQPTVQSRSIGNLLTTDNVLDMPGFEDLNGMPPGFKQNMVTPEAGKSMTGGLGAQSTAQATGQTGPQSASANAAAQAARNAQASSLAAMGPRQLTGLLAQQVSQAVENSGLFYESHLQQWANGERSKTQLSMEPQVRFGAEQIISEKSLDPNAVNLSVRMVAQQLAALDQSKVSLSIQGLFGQPMHLEIEHEREFEQAPEEENQSGNNEVIRPWTARMKLDMPSLGEIEVRLRLVGNRVDIALNGTAQSKARIDPHWEDIQQALSVKGLALTHGQMSTRSGSEA